jgi:hypothetical protein
MFKGLFDKLRNQNERPLVTPSGDPDSIYAQKAQQFRRAPEPHMPSGEFRAVHVEEMVVEHPIVNTT